MAEFKEQQMHVPAAKSGISPASYQGIQLRELAIKAEAQLSADDKLRAQLQVKEKEMNGLMEAAAEAIQQFKSAIESIEKQQQEWLDSSSKIISELALSLATSVVGYEVQNNVELITTSIRSLLQEVVNESEKKLFVNNEDLQFIEANAKSEFDAINNLPGLKIESDSKLARGSCFIKVPDFTIDASIHRKLNHLWSAIAGKEVPVEVTDETPPQDGGES